MCVGALSVFCSVFTRRLYSSRTDRWTPLSAMWRYRGGLGQETANQLAGGSLLLEGDREHDEEDEAEAHLRDLL
eukprot:1857500-Rhodomonas_salina.1